jgi:antagonist of KipI
MDSEILLHIEKAGIQTLVVDKGRKGFQSSGVPVSGFMDKKAGRIANWLVGNEIDAAVLEITLIGPKIKVEGEGLIAFTGADLSVKINGEKVNLYQTIPIKSEDIISFGKAQSGCRAYLAVSGSIKVEEWLNSKSAITPNTDLLTPQSLVSKGDCLVLRKGSQKIFRTYSLEKETQPSSITKIRVIRGPEYDAFAQQSIDAFEKTIFTISPDSNRMGYRLESGTIFKLKQNKDLISSGIVPGTIQVTDSRQTIVLLADAQTSGGYPRIANVINADLDQMAQLKPGDRISFSFISLTSAHELLLIGQEYLRHLVE